MLKRVTCLTVAVLALAAPTFAQECLHGPSETPDQAARRIEALTATRNVNNLEANQPGAQNDVYLRQVELASSPFAAKAPTVKQLNFTPGAELLPGKLIWIWTTTGTTTPFFFPGANRHSLTVFTDRGHLRDGSALPDAIFEIPRGIQ